jgi:putative phage-type endonuclease
VPRLTAEQVEARRQYIGASDISAIAGLNPYRDAFDVLNAKLGFAEERPAADIVRLDLGHLLEPVIRALYVEDQQVTLAPCGTVSHPTEAWAGCTLDSKITGERRGLEIKAVGFRTRLDWDPREEDGIPHYVRCQAAWQMWCVDLEEVDVAALLCSTEFKIWRVTRDKDLEARLIDIGRRFHVENILEQRAPVMTAGDGVRTYLDGKYPPKPAPVVVPADDMVTSMILARKAFGDARDAAAQGHEETTNQILQWLGDHNATACQSDKVDFRYNVNKAGKRVPWCKIKGDQ